MTPGVHPNIALREYLNDESVSASLLKTIVERCPAAAWFESWQNPNRPREASSSSMDQGTIAHALLLEGECSRVEVIDPFDHPAKTTGAIPDGWTNQSIRSARDNAIAAGKIPVLKSAMSSVEAMVAEAKRFIAAIEKEEPAIFEAFQPTGGESETSIVWEDGGVLCRIRPDRMAHDHRLIIDYKTGDTSAQPDVWGRTQMIRMGYYTSAAFYRRGFLKTFNVAPDYVFLVQEQSPPYLCSLVGVEPSAFALGGAKIEHGLELWRRCAKSNRWPAYPARVMYPILPSWEQAQWEEAEAAGIPYDIDKLFERKEGT